MADGQEILLDSLPYVETVHEDYEAYALTLVEEEMAKISPPPMNELPQVKLPEMSQQRYDQVSSGEEVPCYIPEAASPPTDADDADGWRKTVEKARATYEAERLRRMVLELEAEHGGQQWKHYTSSVLDSLSTRLQQDVVQQREVVDEINVQRQQQQQEAGQTLQILSNQWQELVQKKHSLAVATRALESELNTLTY